MDFKNIIVDGKTYNVKDETARSQISQVQGTANNAQATAESALTKATTNESNITTLASENLTISYVAESESLQFNKGIVIGG